MAGATAEPPALTDAPKPSIAEHRVDFNPPLSDQRCHWILTKIREHSITSVLDVGCGEGTLLWSLSNGAPWLPAPALPGFAYTHVTTLHGLDISDAALSLARAAVTPLPPSPSAMPRWAPLRAALWRGGLQSPNAELARADVQCIVASEVVEHLPPAVLAAFAPTLLGCYAPRLLLATTPSYSFNALFLPPDAPESARAEWGYASPSQPGRRVRHDDHRFEWTVAEARAWAAGAGETWGYDVKLAGIGRPAKPDPWGRTVEDNDEDARGCASLVIEFRRREGAEARAARERAWEAWRAAEGAAHADDEAHECIAVIEQAAHASAGQPRPASEIAEAARQAMFERRTDSMRMYELWGREVALACGGSRGALLDALDADPRFAVARGDAEAQQWVVTLLGQAGEDARRAGGAAVESGHGGGWEQSAAPEVPISWRTSQASQAWGPADVSAGGGWGEGAADGGWGAGDAASEGEWGAAAGGGGGWGSTDDVDDTWSNGTNSGGSVDESK